jgi:hydro-lyases, Fe-S type, tartrate/fumarate subfamily, beta region
MKVTMNNFNINDIKQWRDDVKAGDEILLSGIVYTARDAAHKRFMSMINEDKPLPFDISGAVIYYAGPTPARENTPIGSCGPTTSSRMDVFTPRLLNLGLAATIGKGTRSDAVVSAMIENHALYFCAIGGAGALAAKCVKKLDVIAFEELGCESVKRLEIVDFPLIVGIDTHGGNLFKNGG